MDFAAIPRSALTADQVAEVAEFFSYGTNDLTQTTFGFSRDEAGKFLPYYLDNKILPHDPFQVLDREGVYVALLPRAFVSSLSKIKCDYH